MKMNLWIIDYGFCNINSVVSACKELTSELHIINTPFHENPDVPVELSKKLGNQCIVASIDYKIEDQTTNVWKNRGRTETNSNLFEWARSVVNLGAGEIYVTNIDNDGRRQGYDIQNLKKLVNKVEVPVVVFGGAMDWEHFAEGLNEGASGVSGANIFHYKELASLKLRKYLLENDYNVRELSWNTVKVVFTQKPQSLQYILMMMTRHFQINTSIFILMRTSPLQKQGNPF